MPEIIPITAEITHLYKEVRLHALQDTPLAFGSTYARESQLSDADWRQRSLSLNGERKIGFLAIEAGQPCGLVACFRDDQDLTRATIISMWVAPSHRRTGLSWMLLDAVREWANSLGIAELNLMVTNPNHTAISFYQRYGFVKTGRTNPYPNDPAMFEYEMVLPVARKGSASH